MIGGTIDAMARAIHKASEYVSPAGHGGPERVMHRNVPIKAADVVDALGDDGYIIIRTDVLVSMGEVVNQALEPNGSHVLFGGYCPDCGGSCLRGFGVEPVAYVEPSPIEVKP